MVLRDRGRLSFDGTGNTNCDLKSVEQFSRVAAGQKHQYRSVFDRQLQFLQNNIFQ
ncbi:hypothetical protein D3C83_48890 [compost metagenome]